MEQLAMMIVFSVIQIFWYAATALAVGFMASVGWHIGKRLSNGG